MSKLPQNTIYFCTRKVWFFVSKYSKIDLQQYGGIDNMTVFARKTVKNIGGGVKRYIENIASSSKVLGGIGNEVYR